MQRASYSVWLAGSPAPHASLPLPALWVGQNVDWPGRLPTEKECVESGI